jgi:hypothetical protein
MASNADEPMEAAKKNRRRGNGSVEHCGDVIAARVKVPQKPSIRGASRLYLLTSIMCFLFSGALADGALHRKKSPANDSLVGLARSKGHRRLRRAPNPIVIHADCRDFVHGGIHEEQIAAINQAVRRAHRRACGNTE